MHILQHIQGYLLVCRTCHLGYSQKKKEIVLFVCLNCELFIGSKEAKQCIPLAQGDLTDAQL